ncbi:MAG TPA: 4'-phosphopantetheinyl transferase superfamily protein, partial [Cyclobacteriaceae bacterium]
LNIISPQKRLEWISGRILIQNLAVSANIPFHGIHKDEFGKPFLRKSTHQISLSHSYPYVAAQIHPDRSVGIDIEQPKQKLLKIAPRILDAIELEDAGTDIVKHCIYWCAKEALYKVYGKRGLLFTNHLHIKPFTVKESGKLKGWIDANESPSFVDLCYIVTKDYVLVYSNPD